MTFTVLHILDHTLPSRSGYTVRTGHIFNAQQQMGYALHAISSARQAPEHACDASIEGVPVRRTPAFGGIYAHACALQQHVKQAVQQLQPNIVHVHSPVLNFWPTWWSQHVPVVYEIRAFWEDAAVANGKTKANSLRYKATRYAETQACHKAAHVFALCAGLRDDLIARGVSAEKISLSPNVVPPYVTPAPPSLTLQQQLQGKTVLTFMGSLYPYEGVDVLLQAFDLLAPQYPDLALLIVGDGPERARLQTLCPPCDNIIFTGSLPPQQAQACYALSHAIVLPRRDTRLTQTVTPMKIPEAQQHDVMVIASDVGGHREMIEHGRTGYLVDAHTPHNLAIALDNALRQKHTWPTMADAAREAVQTQRSYGVLANAYHRVYQQLCAKR